MLVTALIGVWFISAALQGYVTFLGGFAGDALGWTLRLLLFAAGLCFAYPAGGRYGLSHWTLSALGLALAVVPLIYAWHAGRRGALPLTEGR